MTKGERSELTSLIRKREKVMKAAATERSAKLLAEFEQQMDEKYDFNSDEIWKKAVDVAKEVMSEANRKIAARSKKLGIPPEFSPSLIFYWNDSGQNAVRARRDELRRIAKRKIEGLEAETRTRIEAMSLAAQTEVVAHGIRSIAAREFLEKMPSLETLMPSVTQKDISALLPAKRMGGSGNLLEE
jgi:vacuolar-type H+-ATPase subunit H